MDYLVKTERELINFLSYAEPILPLLVITHLKQYDFFLFDTAKTWVFGLDLSSYNLHTPCRTTIPSTMVLI